ncbi:MAG: cyclase family protein [Deltaproteobacteria bacterium]|nr:cyclase family protein [Deltaproteobacteria bacterium]
MIRYRHLMSSLRAKLVVAAVLVASTTACDTRPARCPKTPKTRSLKVGHCLPQRQRVVDLTHVLQEGMPLWPGGVPFKLTRLTDYDQGNRSHKLEVGDSTGTHVNAPAHFVEGNRTIDQIPVEELVVPAVVLDLRAKVKNQPDYLISANDLVDWEAVHGPVPVGSLVIANTGWHQRFGDPAQYVNQDAEGVMHFPGYGADAAELLMERDVMGIGIDTLSLDAGAATDFVAHRITLSANKIQIENLANLDELPEVGATVIVGVLPVANGTQAQARIIALVPEQEAEEEGAEEGTGP